MEREIFRRNDVYVRPLRKEEKVFENFKDKEFICCSSDGEPLEVFENLADAFQEIKEQGCVRHTLH